MSGNLDQSAGVPREEIPEQTSEQKSTAQKIIISQTLAEINSKLSKLDTLESLNIKLEGILSGLQSRVEDISSTINTVKSDLAKYEQKWERTVNDLADRISELEKSSLSWENRWELQREDLSTDCKVLQKSIDSNSKQIIELESVLDQSKQKLNSLDKLEEKIKNAAEKKFKDIRNMLREDLRKEMLEDIKKIRPPDISHEDLNKVREDLSSQMQTQNTEIMAKMNTQNQEVLSKVQAHQQNLDADLQHSRLKGQAFSNRHNILIFGLAYGNSAENDLKDAQSFFKERMGITGLKINATFRLGPLRQGAFHPRPLVVKFGDIKDRLDGGCGIMKARSNSTRTIRYAYRRTFQSS